MSAPVDESVLVRRLRAAGCVFAEREAALIETAFDDPHDREGAVARREAGEPLEHVVGHAGFAGVTVAIGAGCFVPRARAVALVDAAEQLQPRRVRPVVLDLGCGCGAIAAALTARRPDWTVLACDVDETALEFARRNGAEFGFTVHAGSWFSALPTSLRGRLDVVVAHLPYVPTAEIALLPRDFRDHEPARTVDGGPDGLDPLRDVLAEATDWLHPDGILLTQVANTQAAVAAHIPSSAGLVAVPVPVDDSDRVTDEDAADEVDDDTVVLAMRRGGPNR